MQTQSVPRNPISSLDEEIQFIKVVTLLDSLVLTKSFTTYEKAGAIVGYHQRDWKFQEKLERVIDLDHATGGPFRSALIVSKKFILPGDGFFKKLRSLKYVVGPTRKDERDFHTQQLMQLGVVPTNFVF